MLGSAENGITFTRNGWRNPLEQRRSHLQRVGYRLNEENTLLRLHWQVLDRAQDSAPIEIPLIEDVESLEWRYLDENEEWVDRWPPANLSGQVSENADTRLPRAVELTLETKALGELRHLFYIAQPN